MIGFKARDYLAAIVKVMPSAAGLRIRVDDDRDPALWMQLEIPLVELLALTEACELIRWHENQYDRLPENPCPD